MVDPTPWVGIPFEYGGRGPDKLDCYGLIRVIYQSRGIEIPDYASPTEQMQIAALFGTQLPLWEEVERGPDTVALIRMNKFYSHCGYMLDNERMVHAWRATGGVTVEKLDVWKHRILGFYRYAR